MELVLKGNVIGVISDDFKESEYKGKVSDIVLRKSNDALKMVGLSSEYLDKDYNELGTSDKNKVILASKLQDKEILLINFSKGLTKKEIEFYKKLFKKISSYGRKIILVDKNSEMFINCVDKLYVINKDIVLESNDCFNKDLEEYIDLPKIVEFYYSSDKMGISINQYQEIDELLKAIYRIKS